MPYINFKNIKIAIPKSKLIMAIRILHVLGGMNRGGIETWLMHVLRHIDRDRLQMDFLVHTTQPCAYDDEIRNLGSKIIPCLYPSNPWLYAQNFKRILRQYGPYHIIHSHVLHYSGYVLRLAREAGIPIRIAHSHKDSSPFEVNAKLHRRLYLRLMKAWIARHATLGLGCSKVAAADLFGPNWKTHPQRRLLYYGIDMSPFQRPVDVVEVRKELGIPANAFVVGHVGRFHEHKNHAFLLKIFAEITSKETQACLLLLGEGTLRLKIEQQVMHAGLSDRVIFARARSDIPRIMMGAMDVFLLPSLCEGLPMVSIEAQAAGLPLVLSDLITDELEKIKSLVTKISLSQPAKIWANAVLTARKIKGKTTQAACLAILENSEFNIHQSAKTLAEYYTHEFEKLYKSQ
jgi:glycosyltransferase involved in cell wall biosynthesis